MNQEKKNASTLSQVFCIRCLFFVICIFFLSADFKAQKKDSLWSAWNDQKNPTRQRFSALSDFTWEILFSDPDSAEALASLQLQEASQLKENAFAADAFNTLGTINSMRGNYPAALTFYKQSQKIREQMSDTAALAKTYSNIAVAYKEMGEYVLATELIYKAIRLKELLGDRKGLGNNYNNLAQMFADHIGDSAKALENFKKAESVFKEIDYQKGLCNVYNNLGVWYMSANSFNAAMLYFKKCQEISLATNDVLSLAGSYSNMGLLSRLRHEFIQATHFFSQALELCEKMENKKLISATLINIGEVQLESKKINEAIQQGLKGFAYAKETGTSENLKNACYLLYRAYKFSNNSKKSLEYYEKFIAARDTLYSESVSRELVKKQFQYEYEKKSAADSVKNAEEQKVKDARLTAQNAQIKQERFQRYSLFAGLLVVLGGLGFAVNRFRVTSKQKKIIERQKIQVLEAFEKLHEKNTEVIDSIYYARRIQRALITNENYIRKKLAALRK